MPDKVTLAEVENLVEQLPPRDQLWLAVRICERVNVLLPEPPVPMDEESVRQREKEADELLARLDAVAELFDGEFDSAEEIRKMREERDEQIWPSKR